MNAIVFGFIIGGAMWLLTCYCIPNRLERLAWMYGFLALTATAWQVAG